MIKAKYRHLRRSQDNVLYATICIITDTEIPNRNGIGVSICGDNENFSRKEGRRISYRRAIRAIKSGKRDRKIKNYKVRNVFTFLTENPVFGMYPYKVLPEEVTNDFL